MTSKKEKTPRLVQKWEKDAELEDKLEEILPEPEFIPEPKETEIQDLQINYKTENDNVVLEKPRMIEKRTKRLPENKDLVKILNLRHHGRIYFDKRDCEDYLYIFHNNPKRRYPRGRIKLDKTNVYNLLAYCIATIYGEHILKLKYPEIWVTKKMQKKIQEILSWIEITYADRI